MPSRTWSLPTLVISCSLSLLGCDTETSDETFRSGGHGGHGGHGSHGGHGGHGSHGHHGHGHHGHGGHGRTWLDIRDLLEDYDADTNPYSDPALWVAGPDAAEDFVLSVDLSTTIVYPDLSTEIIHPQRPVTPELDIFYIHPTVNLSPIPGNDDLSDATTLHAFVKESVARFSTIGRVIAPRYHSGTAGCFLAGGTTLEDCLEIAYADVEASFAHYLANHWDGQKLVIAGWSQGAIMTRMLMQRFVQDHPDLMSRVAVVMPMSGDLELDSFAEIPACEEDDETGCYLAFHAFLDGAEPQPGTVIGDWADAEAACTDVAGAADEDGLLTLSVFSTPTVPGLLPTDALQPLPITIDTPFFAFSGYYAGGCVDGYMEVTQADSGDPRWTPINYAHPFVVADPPFGLGLHIFDWSLAMGDLLYLVETKADELEDNCRFRVRK
jgi:hypothetical protein